ncbi:exodeoxyribonuclease III [Terrilactibacillus sp. BCM23-1]|uniref:Exodeoxyribonuclease III n=1 Tax=Terrilactibacillus tamarindi TaxID=2599694 RepID=A0A6N8CWX9_9BACI|nr:exodeoxyribonuclease III [Terrilactibacillus tamarindi]MTT33316.1 exodeoxyribonuclease III [Terrilactibacillus tamarindi]
MKLISWNVNGLRALMAKGEFLGFIERLNPDIFCLQEIKLQDGQLDPFLTHYKSYWHYAVKKGYSETVIFTKKEPLTIAYGLGIEEHDQEGRLITLEFEDFYILTVYTPNSKRGLERLDYRMKWEDAFLSYITDLDKKKPVIVCGDFNVAHQEIDIKNPKANRNNAGFSDQEREKFSQLLNAGFVDTYRYLHPDQEGAYTWWSYIMKARAKNIGWRLDYFLISERIKEKMINASILSDVMGSDHCPIELEIDI